MATQQFIQALSAEQPQRVSLSHSPQVTPTPRAEATPAPIQPPLASHFLAGSRTPECESEKLLIAFICDFLQIEYYVGVQSGFGLKPDMILFNVLVNGVSQPTTLSVPVEILRLRPSDAREIVRTKITETRKAFGQSVKTGLEEEEGNNTTGANETAIAWG